MNKPVLTVIFQGAPELRAQRPHLAKGALLLPEPDPPPEPFAEIVLRVEGVNGESVELEGRVLHIFEGRGIAVSFDDVARAQKELAPLLDAADAAQAPKSAEEGATWIFWGRSNASNPHPPPASDKPDAPDAAELHDPSLHQQLATMTTAQKIQLALKGDRTARLLLLKDINKTLHTFLLQNPRITLDEVKFMARFKQTSAEALETIAGNPDYVRHQAVVAALVRNPRTPGPIAARLVDKLPDAEVRRLAKSNDVPRAVQAAARKRINE
jgi:hypothetical protein